ncbi:ribonuclease G [Paraliobacillus quinghaiensis]|uniref:Ribonuclease G n=1 Tax=Paraliobacillus quinghaiensis TaxID=470815 RepID=A0A917WTI1_9BACI|nr:ribonuclease E/G [Paraliobacillus quinghaiensis]GGM27369.1 ribonuclease G [Paraliobacillus quinghaiensis]
MISLFISTQTTEKIALAIENNEIKEVVIDRPSQRQLVGSIFVGKVNKVEKGLQAAFIDIGADKLGFLQRNELPIARANPDKKIESLITEGARIIVQVIKDAYDTKGARLTANITIPDQSIVYLPYGNYIAASKKLEGDSGKEKKNLIEKLRNDREGAIIRTAAVAYSDKEIEQTFLHLRKRWIHLEKISRKSKVPSCLHYDAPVLDRFIRKFSPREIEHIYIDDPSIAKDLRDRYLYLEAPITWERKLEKHLPKTINQVLDEIVQPKVEANNGVSIYIEETEAMTIIDVNSGGYTGKTDKARTHLQVNISAARLIARQMRLRNLSGIIIIDFIDMKSSSDERKVMDVLKKELIDDPIRSEIYGFTRLGLLEITRKREAPPHSKLLIGAEDSNRTKYANLTYVYALERELFSYINSDVESLFVEINPTIYKLWQQQVDLVKLKEMMHYSLYMYSTKKVASYKIKLAGSSELTEDYLAMNSHLLVDKEF